MISYRVEKRGASRYAAVSKPEGVTIRDHMESEIQAWLFIRSRYWLDISQEMQNYKVQHTIQNYEKLAALLRHYHSASVRPFMIREEKRDEKFVRHY